MPIFLFDMDCKKLIFKPKEQVFKVLFDGYGIVHIHIPDDCKDSPPIEMLQMALDDIFEVMNA